MCLPTGSNARRLLPIGMICLAVALLSQSLNITFGLAPLPLHFLRGLLIGISLAINLRSLQLRRHSIRKACGGRLDSC